LYKNYFRWREGFTFKGENLSLSIPIFFPNGKENIIYINLKKIDKDIFIHVLCENINQLEKKIEDKDKIIDNILKRIDLLEQKEKKEMKI